MVLKDVSDTVTAWTLYLLSVKFIFALFHINSFHFHLKTDLKINNKKNTISRVAEQLKGRSYKSRGGVLQIELDF